MRQAGTTPLVVLLALLAAPLAAGQQQSVRELADTFRKSRDPARRVAAARALARHGARARGILPILLDGLRDPDPTICRAAAHALGRIGDTSALRDLAALLDSPAAALAGAREESALALGRLRDERAVPALLQALRKRPPVLAAAGALAALQGERAVPALGRALARSSRALQRRCLALLGSLGSPAALSYIQPFLDPAQPLAPEAVGALGRIGGPDGLRPLLVLLRQPTDRLELTEAALRVAARYAHDDATTTVRGLAGHPVPSVREAVALALGRIGDAQGLAALQGLARDESWAVRARAATALGRLGQAGSTRPLVRLLADPVRHVRLDAARALGDSCLAAAAAPLVGALPGERDAVVRAGILRALEQRGDPQATPAVLSALFDEEAPVRAAAASALGGIGAVRSLLHLYRALDDPSAAVRAATARALARLRPGIGLALAERALERETDARTRIWLFAVLLRGTRQPQHAAALHRRLRAGGAHGLLAAQALAAAGHRAAFELVASRLSRADPAERAGYIAALGGTGDERGVDVLRVLLERPPGAVPFIEQLALIRALGRPESRRATPVLARYARAPRGDRWPPDGWQQVQLRLAAIRALGRIATEEAADAILPAWNDANPRVRRVAADRLVALGPRVVKLLRSRALEAQGGKRQWISRVVARIR